MVTSIIGHSIITLEREKISNRSFYCELIHHPIFKNLHKLKIPMIININKLSRQKTTDKYLIFNVSIGPSFSHLHNSTSMVQLLCLCKHVTIFVFLQACNDLHVYESMLQPLHFYDLDTLF